MSVFDRIGSGFGSLLAAPFSMFGSAGGSFFGSVFPTDFVLKMGLMALAVVFLILVVA